MKRGVQWATAFQVEREDEYDGIKFIKPQKTTKTRS